jgi:hypothetical protein
LKQGSGRGWEHSEKWEQINSAIAKTDRKIDGAVYKLYGLTEEEIKIVDHQTSSKNLYEELQGSATCLRKL